MSHIPGSAMKHAGPVHHEAGEEHAPARPREADGLGLGAWLAIGGALFAGAAAAIAVPLLKARATPVPRRRGKRASVRSRPKAKTSTK